MKIIHTSDIHLASPLTAHLGAQKLARRARELEESFADICQRGEELGAEAMIIAGDLFDSQRITAKNLDTVLAIIERHSGITFFYLSGNHERDALARNAGSLPENLKLFGNDWTYFSLGGIMLAGACETSADMFSRLRLGDGKNIVVLHGELRDRSDEGGVIGIKDCANLPIDYMALGHYHSYQRIPLAKGEAVYSGTPEGRGFDEAGDKGFCLIDVSEAGVIHRFIPSAKRRLIIAEADISEALSTSLVERRIEARVGSIGSENLVRVLLTGSRELDLRLDLNIIKSRFERQFFYFEIKDTSRLVTRAEDYMYDKSVRGEFIRLCMADSTLSDEERQRIIHCGLAAMAGEAFDE